MRAGKLQRTLALSHFLLAVLACFLIYVFPAAGLWPILLSIVPFGVRLFIDRPVFHHRWVDGLLGIFLVTALIGYWAAYDRTAAWMKLDLLAVGILLYYAISTQPESNLGVLAGFWFVFGVGVCLYFLLTLDFGVSPAKFHIINQIGLQWMAIRPAVRWPAIQPTDTAAGIAILTSVYGFCFVVPEDKTPRNRLITVFVLAGFGIVLAAILLATSRGALVAVAAAVVLLLVWLALRRMGSRQEIVDKFFPLGVLLLFGLTALLLILPLRIFNSGFFIGENLILNRSELIRNGISILLNFPFIGGGLDSFPGLFSQDILVIPYYSLQNSHNLFVDVSIEQGMIGGLAFLLLYSIGLWKTASLLGRGHSRKMHVFYGAAFTSLLIAMVHGLVDDYLYSGWWAALAFLPAGDGHAGCGNRVCTGTGHGARWFILGADITEFRLVGVRGFFLAGTILVVAIVGWNGNRIAAHWFANLGAVKLDKVELAEYPANQWDDGGRSSEMQPARMLLVRSLEYDATNWSANYHLGLVEMSERDFDSAAKHLAMAYQQKPWHRGIIKNLGYSYAWLGEMDDACLYLEMIPEAKSELDVYVWWWDTQGRPDLSANAGLLASRLKPANVQQ